MSKKLYLQPRHIDKVIEKCAAMSGISSVEIMEETRKSEVITARQRAMYFLKNYTPLSLAKIGNIMGGKDHATVLHALKCVLNFSENNREYATQVSEIENFVIQLCQFPDEKEKEPETTPEIQQEEKRTERPQFLTKSQKQYKALSEDLIVKNRLLEQTVWEQNKLIQSLSSELKISEAQTRLFKRKLEYAQMPERILDGSHF